MGNIQDEIQNVVDIINNKCGSISDNYDTNTLISYGNYSYQHVHQPAKCYPTLTNGVTIIGGTPSWTLGSITEFIPANAINTSFDIHWINIEEASANDVYELVFYKGLSGSEVEICRIRTYKQSNITSASNVPVQIAPQPPNTRISCAIASASGGDNLTISVFYHEYT